MSYPLWLRQERAQVRQLELRIVKTRATLALQEDEVAHELYATIGQIDKSVQILKINRQRLLSAKKRVLATQAEHEREKARDEIRPSPSSVVKSIDNYLRAQNSLTAAKVEYYKNVTELNKSLRDLLYRMGRLLTADGISLLGVDGLPVLPPPEPEEGPYNVPVPSDPDKPLEEPKGPTPRVAGRPRVLDANAAYESQNDDVDDLTIPNSLIEKEPPELSDEIPAIKGSKSTKINWSELIDESEEDSEEEIDDTKVTPVSGKR